MGLQILRNTFLVALIVSLFACSNIFSEFGGRESDAAYYEDARKLLNAQNWEQAISKFQKLSSGFLKQKKVRMEYASALAGHCGVNFLGYLEDLADADLTGSTIMLFLMNRFTGVTIRPEFCSQASEQMRLLQSDYGLENSQRLFFAVLSMAQVGSYLRFRADDLPDSIGDGTVDAGFNSCSSTSLPDEAVTEVITGFTTLLRQITEVDLGLSTDLQTNLANFQSICSLTVPFNPSPCNETDPDAVTADQIASMRDLLKSSTLGIEGCLITNNTCCP